MTTQLKVEGMSCGHCVIAVRKALESLPGVQEANVNLADGSAAVTHNGEVQTEKMVAAIEEEGYSATPQVE